NDRYQRCSSFSIVTDPVSNPLKYTDYAGNTVNHFNIPTQHSQLTIKTESIVERRVSPELPETLELAQWELFDSLQSDIQFWDFLKPSQFATPTDQLIAFEQELKLTRTEDPLNLLRWLNTTIYESFQYQSNSTEVDSPIDDALISRQGVCQDFSHIMITLVRRLGIPCRYVSGYLFHRPNQDRSMEDASHAWVEAWLPSLGWIGFDPTNNLIAGERHIRVAIGRDYADVPPTSGVYRGEATSELDVGVQIMKIEDHQPVPKMLLNEIKWDPQSSDEIGSIFQQQQQQQQ
ncbi:MAG: transglutaminase family protein, partial [Chloroflexota bacterium]